jgi:hypothetical protein
LLDFIGSMPTDKALPLPPGRFRYRKPLNLLVFCLRMNGVGRLLLRGCMLTGSSRANPHVPGPGDEMTRLAGREEAVG